MALDIYVMPLWRFKAGDFASPVERAIGLSPKIATPDGIEERPVRVGWLDRWPAKREVRAIRRAVERANEVPIRWRDEGEVVYAEQSRGMEPLRAYAMWLDHRDRLPEFEPPPEGNFANHPALAQESDRPLTYPHLVGHDCFSGYFFPCDFPRITEVEPYLILGTWPASRYVGSSERLRRELTAIAGHLPAPSGEPTPDDSPLIAVRTAFRQLRNVVELSCRYELPIVFWG